MELNTIANEAVKSFATDIITQATEYNTDIDIDLEFTEIHNIEETSTAYKAIITSEYGTVIVFPDFAKNNTKATILNLGEINMLRKEGFSEEFIYTKGTIYGDLLSYNKKSTKIFGYYLTHRLNSYD